ncbi:unnamed protein product [Taenia asiatica]|uniref:Transmembrane protein n=1 Tax=Taenia asiatica TaxID=60517 RepID=A0A0R3W2I5_TAEAS|nr:unnamed protein product [Taenia asiatica]
MGACDIANSFGTSVDSRAISLRTACILATICELAKSVSLRARVSNTIKKDIVDLDQFDTARAANPLLNGHLSALNGKKRCLKYACVWLLLAMLLELPVSVFHSIVSAVVGFSLVRFGRSDVNWCKTSEIAGSWLFSPISSGALLAVVFFCVKKEKSLEPALMTLSFLYGIIVAINAFVLIIRGS